MSEHQHWEDVIRLFRIGMEAQANTELVKFIDSLAAFIEANGDKMGSKEAELLNNIFTAQSQGDFLYLADLLEYELPKSALSSLLGPVNTNSKSALTGPSFIAN